jgi:hypothetical protein
VTTARRHPLAGPTVEEARKREADAYRAFQEDQDDPSAYLEARAHREALEARQAARKARS